MNLNFVDNLSQPQIVDFNADTLAHKLFTSQTTKLKSIKQLFKFVWPSQSYKTLNSYWL